MKHMFAVRSHFGDPGENNTFLDMDEILDSILNDTYVNELRSLYSIQTSFKHVLREGTSDSETQGASFYGGRYKLDNAALMDAGTSHICVTDAEGNAVSMTSSINGLFGSYMISPKTGLLLNNHMNDFSKPGMIENRQHASPPASANFIRPGRKPLSSMSPLLFDKDGALHMAIGGSGGPFIISALLQVVYNHLGLGMDLEQAIIDPRLSDFLSGVTIYEHRNKGSVAFAVDKDILESLSQKVRPQGMARVLNRLIVQGHQTLAMDVDSGFPPYFFSNIVAIEVPESGLFRGIVDPRKDGAAASNL